MRPVADKLITSALAVPLAMAMVMASSAPAFSAMMQVSRVEVRAATDAAVKGLKQQVDRLPLGPKLTVGQYLDSVRANEFMLATLQRAQLIGGPRPIDDRTVQVRLDITGRLVADALAQVAAVYQKQSPHSPKFIIDQSRAWADRTFTATGSSSGAILGSGTFDPRSQRVAPELSQQSAAVPAIPPEAIAAAMRSVATAVISKVAEVALPEGKRGADLVGLPGVADALTTHVLSRPTRDATVQEGGPNAGEVRVMVLLDKSAFFDTLKTAATSSGKSGVVDDAGWSGLREPILAVIPEELQGIARPATARPGEGAGQAPRGGAPRGEGPGGEAPRGELPPPGTTDRGPTLVFPLDRPPRWTADAIDASGTSAFSGSKLLTARVAEEDARRRLASRLQGLELAPDLTLADAARRDPRFAEPLNRALQRSRVFRVEYAEDGSASVKISTDTRELWQDLVRLAN